MPFTYNVPFFSIFLALLSAVSVPFLKNGEQALRMIRVVQAVVAALSAALLAHLPLLARFGFEAEDFGGGALIVRAAPSDVAAGEIPDVLSELAGRLLTGGSADPGTFVGNFLSTAKLHTNFNAFCYSDPETDKIVNEAGAETDRAKRTELYHELIKEALDTNIGVFYATSYLSWGLNERVHGYVQENKAVMRVCGLEGTGINIWVTE